MNARGQYGTSRLEDDANRARLIHDIARVVEPRSVFYDPDAFKVDPEAQRHVEHVVEEHPTRTGAILLAALGTIVTIGIVGTKKKMRWF